MKILFLSPPQKNLLFPPLGIAYLTSFLNQNGHEAIIVEGNNKTYKQIIKTVEKIKPNIIGITMTTSTRFLCLNLAKEIKFRFNLPIILGGPHPTLMPEQLLKNYPFIDYIIRNEGEYTCLNLINALEKKDKLDKINGLSYKKDGNIIHNPAALPIMDLDSLPYPEYKFFNLKGYSKHTEDPPELVDYPVGCIISSRGCPYRCSFCSSSNFWGHKIRFRKAKYVVDEMEQLYLKYNTRYIVFNDDHFAADRKRAIEICKLIIKKGLHKKIKWLCKSEVNIITEELLIWLKKAGCYVIEYGIEDVSPEGLKFFRKAHNMDQVFEAFRLTHNAGIQIRSYFIIGGDHETKENILLKKKTIEKLNPATTTASLLLAYPGTEIFELGKTRGWWDDNIFLKSCIGKKFHYGVPIFPSKNMNLEQMFEASADIDYWWNKKKGNIILKNIYFIVLGLLKSKDFSKLFFMTKSVLQRTLNRKSSI